MKLKHIVLSIAILTSISYAWEIEKKIIVDEPLDKIKLQNKTLHLDVGIGSGAYHYKGDAKNIIYTITDRGPNIKCKDSMKLMGEKLCAKGKIFPTPNFSPTIYKIALYSNWYKVLEKIQIKDRDGKPVSGISNNGTEKAYDLKGNPLKFDPNGLDAEALVKLSDGTFWIAEEYGASILHIDSDGKILKRVIPKGFKKNLDGANYDISESLSSIISKRKLNRGIESIGVSPDEKTLYFSMQSPLANPDVKSYKKSANVRIFKYDIKNDTVIGEYIYKLDNPNTFSLDKNKKQNSIKISELVATGNDELILLERISKTTKFYKVKLKDSLSILGSDWDDENTLPSLEQTENFDKFLSKKLVLDTSLLKGMPKKVEGIAYIDANNWILVNDNDFGINRYKTYLVEIKN